MLNLTKEALKKKFQDLEAIKFGNFTLASGRESSFFIDVKKVSFDPEGADLIGIVGENHILERERKINMTYALASVASGGTYVAKDIGRKMGRPIISVKIRTQSNNHIEGNFEAGRNYMLIEDVVTTAYSSLRAIDYLEDMGAIVEYVLAMVDREEGGADTLQDAGYDFEAIFTKTDLGVK